MKDDSQEFRALVNAESRVLALQEAWLHTIDIRQSIVLAEKFMLNGQASGATQALRDVALFANTLADKMHGHLASFAEDEAPSDSSGDPA